jgi:hypothetical protein
MRRLGPLATGAIAVALVCSVPRAAWAAASAHLVYLRGPGAEQCAGEQVLRAAVSARLGYDPFFAWAPDTLFAEIQYVDGAFRAVVKLVDRNNTQRGAREISVQGGDCSVVIDALGLTISLTIDPSSVVGGPSPTPAPASPPPAPEPAAVAPPSPTVPREAIPPLAPASLPEWSLHAGAGVIAAAKAAPLPTAGVTAFVGLAWRALSVDVEGRADGPETGNGTRPDLGQVRSWLVIGSLVPCVHVRVGFGCAVLAGGWLGATAQGVQRPTQQYGPWSAIGGRFGSEWTPVGSQVSLRAYAELLGVLTRDTLWIDSSPVYTVASWSAAIGVAGAWRFR